MKLINHEAVSIKYYEFVSVFLPYLSSRQITYFLCHILLLSVAHLAVPVFQNYLTKSMFFRKKKLLNIKHVFGLSLQLLSQTCLILRRIKYGIIINVHRSSHQVPLILVVL